MKYTCAKLTVNVELIYLQKYCWNGCQGACACPVLAKEGSVTQVDPTFERRAEKVLKTILVHPDLLQDILLNEKELTEILEVKLIERISTKRQKERRSRKSSLAIETEKVLHRL